VAGAVFDVCDERFGFAESLEDKADDFEICFFVVSADVVDACWGSLCEDFPYSGAMVIDIEPVSDIEAVAVDWEGLV